MKQRHKQKLVVLSIVLFIMFNAPVLLLFNRSEGVPSIPVIYAYIFTVWFGSSIASFLVFRKFDE